MMLPSHNERRAVVRRSAARSTDDGDMSRRRARALAGFAASSSVMPSANLRNSGLAPHLCGRFAIALHECFRHTRGPGDDRLPHRPRRSRSGSGSCGSGRAASYAAVTSRDAIREQSNAVGRAPGAAVERPPRRAAQAHAPRRTHRRIAGWPATRLFGLRRACRDEPFVGRAAAIDTSARRSASHRSRSVLDLDRTEVDVPGSEIGGLRPGGCSSKCSSRSRSSGGKLTCNRRRRPMQAQRDDQDRLQCGRIFARMFGATCPPPVCLGYTFARS